MFTTSELAAVSGKSLSVVGQSLSLLEKQGLIFKIYRGIWAETGNGRVSPYNVIPFLFPMQRVYVSFVSALHIHGIIEQIPQVITLASTSHTRIVQTKVGTFSVHKITAPFFSGFDWYKGDGNFLVAEAEKALIDSLYLSGCRKKQFSYFPELHFTKSFNFKKAESWIQEIPDARIKLYVQKKFNVLKSQK